MHPRVPEQPKTGLPRQVVYAPACVTRMMGPSGSDSEQASVHEKLLSLFDKAGYEVIYPEVCPNPCLHFAVMVLLVVYTGIMWNVHAYCLMLFRSE